LTCDARSFVDMAAGGAITNKTLDDAFMLIENIAFNQFQYNEKPSSDLLVSCHQVTIPQQSTLDKKHESDSSRDKVELSWVLFDDDDDDDAIISDTPMAAQMDTIVQDSPILLNDSFICETELQSVEFDIEEPPLGDIDDVLLKIEMEKFIFEDVSNIGSSPFEPEMEIFTIDDEEAASYVKELNCTTSSTTIAHQANYTTVPPMASPFKVVLKLLNHLRCLFEGYFKLPHVLSRPQDEHVRVDIPWDPGGFMAWCGGEKLGWHEEKSEESVKKRRRMQMVTSR
jgi:hypothetical protein